MYHYAPDDLQDCSPPLVDLDAFPVTCLRVSCQFSFGSAATRREFTRQRDAFYTPTTHSCNQYTHSHPASRPGLCAVVTSLHGRDAFYSDNSSRDQWLAFLSAYAFVLVTAL